MSIITPVIRDSRIIGSNPDPNLTDVVGVSSTRINPDTLTTYINDSSASLVLSMGGAGRMFSKNIKLINGVGATINTNGGTIMLDSANTSGDFVYDITEGLWLSTPPGLVIPSTPQGTWIVGSGSTDSARDIALASQGFPGTIAMSADGTTVASGAPGFGEVSLTDTGVIWVYKRDGVDWVEKQRLNTNQIQKSALGLYVDISANGNTIVSAAGGDNVAVSVPGVVIFEYDIINDKYIETVPAIFPTYPTVPGFEYIVSEPGERAVRAVNINDAGNIIVIGANVQDAASMEPNTHVMWIYEKNATTLQWSLLQIIDDSSYTADSFGSLAKISADGSTIATLKGEIGGTFSVVNPEILSPRVIGTYTRTPTNLKQQFTIEVDNATAAIDGTYFVVPTIASNGDPIFEIYWFDTTGVTPAPVYAGATIKKIDLTAVVFPDDNAVATAISARIFFINANLSVSVIGNVVTVSNIYPGSTPHAHDGTDAPSGLIFNTIVIGAKIGQYTNGPIITDNNHIGEIAINANGTVLTAVRTDGLAVYSKSGMIWTQDAVFLADFVPESNFFTGLDINAHGNVIMVGSPVSLDYGAVWVLVNTNGTWVIKAGPIEPAGDNVFIGFFGLLYGSSVSMSGSGNLSMVGAAVYTDNTLGIGYEWSVNITGVVATSSSYFVITSPVDATLFGLISPVYWIWYRTDNTSIAPPDQPSGGFTPTYIKIEVDIRGVPSSPASAYEFAVAVATAEAINNNISNKFIATAIGSTIRIKSKFSGITGGVQDSSVVLYKTNFAFTLTTAGQAAPATGAITPFG